MQNDLVVYLTQCQSYSSASIKDFLDLSLSVLMKNTMRSSRVLLKPNLISPKGSGLACTHPIVILALAEWLQDHGAKVFVGDSPAFGSAKSVLKGIGIDKKLARSNVGIIEFSTVVNKRLNCGVEVGVAAEIFEHDVLLNLPKIKAHNQMYVTMAVKNIFGIIKGMRKSMLHMKHGGSDNMFSEIIIDLLDILPKKFNVADGIEVMHKEGPISGENLHFGCLACSENPVALDTALLDALEVKPEKSKLWCEARRRKYSGYDLSTLTFPLQEPQSFYNSRFEAPGELSPIRFNPFRFLWGNLKRAGLKIQGV